jgi:hypothetical protein
MSRRIRLQISGSLGTDLTTVTIYHTSVDALNVLTSSITASELTTGILFDVGDNTSSFWAKSDNGKCLNTSQSVTIQNVGNNRFFNVGSDGQGTVQINAPISDGPSTSTLTQTVNFNVESFFSIQANATYPATFDGWYNKPSGSTGEAQWSTSSSLTITNTTFTGSDDFYAYFS